MKKLFLLVLLCFIFLSCKTESESPKLKIGKRYKMCGKKEDNPFEKRAMSDVIIIDIKNEYVLYCWYYDYKKDNIATFTRSEEVFNDYVQECIENP